MRPRYYAFFHGRHEALAMHLPPAITAFIDGATLRRDVLGESPCTVQRFRKGNDVFFLKFSPSVYAATTYSVQREAAVMQWLSGKLKVPDVVAMVETPAGAFMITRAVPGRPLSAVKSAQHAGLLLQEAWRLVQAVPIDDCPFESGGAYRLRELDALLAQGLVADDHDVVQWPGLATPADLQRLLHATMPAEELVFSHGDLGDSNVFVDRRDDLYFIDLGRGGKADRWLDIAFVHRELRESISEQLAANFLLHLGRPDEPAKRLFYEQLDELF
jgi:aminoglycoside phosphotransferase